MSENLKNICAMIQRIRQIMEQRALTINGFAKATQLDPGNFQRKMKGQQNITERDIYKICTSLGVSRTWLTTGEGDMYAPDDSYARPVIMQSNSHVHGDAQNVIGSGDTAALMKEVELLRSENAWLRSLVEARLKTT